MASSSGGGEQLRIPAPNQRQSRVLDFLLPEERRTTRPKRYREKLDPFNRRFYSWKKKTKEDFCKRCNWLFRSLGQKERLELYSFYGNWKFRVVRVRMVEPEADVEVDPQAEERENNQNIVQSTSDDDDFDFEVNQNWNFDFPPTPPPSPPPATQSATIPTTTATAVTAATTATTIPTPATQSATTTFTVPIPIPTATQSATTTPATTIPIPATQSTTTTVTIPTPATQSTTITIPSPATQSAATTFTIPIPIPTATQSATTPATTIPTITIPIPIPATQSTTTTVTIPTITIPTPTTQSTTITIPTPSPNPPPPPRPPPPPPPKVRRATGSGSGSGTGTGTGTGSEDEYTTLSYQLQKIENAINQRKKSMAMLKKKLFGDTEDFAVLAKISAFLRVILLELPDQRFPLVITQVEEGIRKEMQESFGKSVLKHNVLTSDVSVLLTRFFRDVVKLFKLTFDGDACYISVVERYSKVSKKFEPLKNLIAEFDSLQLQKENLDQTLKAMGRD